MYIAPESYNTLIKTYTNTLASRELARTLIHVELTLHLAMRLGLSFEPLTIGWVLLSRAPLHHELFDRLLPEQRRMWANAAQLIPLSSRAAWQAALAQYGQAIPAEHRLYNIPSLEQLDELVIEDCLKRPSPDPWREAKYDTILNDTLRPEERIRRETIPGKTYRVIVRTENGVRIGHIRIRDDLVPTQAGEQKWFKTNRPRTVIKLRLRDLLPTAEFLDQREQQMGGRVHWVDDLKNIRFRRAIIRDGEVAALQAEETAEMENVEGLTIEGMMHLPGMVSTGKTTLAKLIIAHCLRLNLDVRITFVVGDSQTAISTAHQINSWFHNDPAGDDVSAVPLMGVSQRAVHWQRLTASKEYRQCVQDGRPHWGERWLQPVCLIEPHIRWEGSSDVEIPLGSEPCESFFSEQYSKQKKRKSKGQRHVCPLTGVCPAKQIYRDMPKARVWITTPGALSQASLPLYWDSRIARIGELVYEQSDLVILDEVETIVDWFDKTYARTEPLTNGKNGLLDKLDPQIAQFWLPDRLLKNAAQRRWILAAREALKALTGVLSAIADPKQQREVKTWVRSGYFSPNQLAYRLARRLAGLKEWDESRLPNEVKIEHDQQTNEAFKPFNQLLNSFIDPLRRSPTREHATDALAGIMQAINNLTDNVADNGIFEQCKAWVTLYYPDIETRLAALKQQLEQSESEYDRKYAEDLLDRSADDIARRLQFLLLVALLDRHIHIVIEEWYNKPDELDVAQPFSRIPRSMRHILPLPLTGQQYGFVIDLTGKNSANHLSLFAYTNIGRSYLLNFHQLLSDFDGELGPHVLALSGTSYLPDSTAFHVDILPAGVLMPAKQVEQALEMSAFIWQPFYQKDKPILISGRPKMCQQLRKLVNAMFEYDGGVPGGFIGAILAQIEKNAQDEQFGHLWRDRDRVLLLTNSYKQAHEVAITLRDGWREAADTIYELKRGSGDQDYEIEVTSTLPRMDIEQFAETKGRVLVAPMQSIGRGFNILNEQRIAAFGAVLFLTRPMNPPHDREAIAQELNRLALNWAADKNFHVWGHDTLYKRAKEVRVAAETARRSIERRRSYAEFKDDETLKLYPRRDLAATSAGRVIQAVGRLLRGGVPFYAYFVDAAWSPESAKGENIHDIEPEETSLLTAMIDVLAEYATMPVGEALYSKMSEALWATIHRDSN